MTLFCGMKVAQETRIWNTRYSRKSHVVDYEALKRMVRSFAS